MQPKTFYQRENRLVQYWREFKEEFNKVTWVGKEELLFLTKVVVAAIVLLGFGIYGVDLLIKNILKLLRF